jgi:hypothetical protein
MEIKQLNKVIQSDLKHSKSHGLEVFIEEVTKAQKFNAKQPQIRRNGEEYRRQFVTVYFSYVTENRLRAHIIRNFDTRVEDRSLVRLWIPEAGHRLYANYKDGYQVNGGGYNKSFHILEAMVFQAKKHIDVNKGVGHWQDFIKAEVIS